MADHLAFMISQAAHIESQVYQIKYPNIQYQDLLPIDTSAHPYAEQITWFSQDGVGAADFLATYANDFPIVDTDRQKYDVRVENLGIGYRFNHFEVHTAMLLGRNLAADDAIIARRVAEEKIDSIALYGEEKQGWDGLLNSSALMPSVAPVEGSNQYWVDKSGPAIAKDINDALSGIHVDSLQVELADTILLPVAMRDLIATKQFQSGTDTSVLAWVMANNVYTAQTGRPLTIRTVRGLEVAGAANSGSSLAARNGRMIAYSRDPQILKLHMPMPLMFFPPQQQFLTYIVMGVFRLGGLEIRRPGGIRYVDGIMEPPSA